MTQKRTRFRSSTLVASTDPVKNIQAKRLVMVVRHTTSFNPTILSVTAHSIRTAYNQ